MKSKFTILMIILMSMMAITTSCAKDEEDEKEPVVEVRAQAYGNYSGTVKMYEQSTMTEVGEEIVDVSVIANPNDVNSILLVQDGETLFKCTKIAEASNGFTFDIQSQEINLDGDIMEVVGENHFELGGTKYHGMYNSSTKLIDLAAVATVNNVEVLLLLTVAK